MHHKKSGFLIMRFDRIRTIIFCNSIAAAAASFAAAPATAQTPYDGLWDVTVVTKTGSCEASAHYPLTVTDGKVTAAGADVSGHVGREGSVKVSIGAAYANGQLNGNTGSGKWNGASGGVPCSGHWEASRQ
jgi:hypothetical protein